MLYVADWFCKVVKEGQEEEMFGKSFPPSEAEREEGKSEEEDENSDQDVLNLSLGDAAKLMRQVKSMGYGVDDDNVLAPKNIPDTGTSPTPSRARCVYKE
eukprot:11481432-Ditylum_brightwellii.AAC.1